MEQWWAGISLLERALFWIATPFTMILVIQTILLAFGHHGDASLDSDTSGLDLDGGFDGHDGLDAPGGFFDHDGLGDHDFDHDLDHDHDAAGHDAGLRILSMRGIVGFFAVGSWAGIVAIECGLLAPLALLIALAAGAACMIAIAYMMLAFTSLQESGTMEPHSALGRIATVYIPIPAKRSGSGKINVTVSGALTEMDAVTDGPALPTGSSVRVIDLLSGNILVVESIS